MSDGGIITFPTGNPTVYVGLSISASQAFANNLAPLSILGLNRPTRTYRCEVSLVLTALATAAANVAFNVISTDAAGAFTAPVPLVASLAGVPTPTVNLGAGGVQRAAGALIFQSNGLATDVSVSITGITTPGALAGIWTAVFTPVG
jgi:hypothetical protein